MMMMVAAQGLLTLAAVNLWQTGIRSFCKYSKIKQGWTEDELWARLRVELIARVNKPEEWELQTIRAVLVEEVNLSIEEAEYWYERFADETPLLDGLKALSISKN